MHWAHLQPGPAAAVRAEVARLTDMGIGGVLVPQVLAPPWATLGAVAMCDDRVELASGIAMGFVRSPLETAMAGLDLDRLSGGRFTLGLGSSVRAWNVDRFGVPYDRPVSRLRELVALVRRLTSADEQPRAGRFEGDFWTVDMSGVRLPKPVRPRLPISLAPLRAPMIELAAEVADGILGHPIWSPRWIATEVRAAIERGLERSGRARSDVRVTAWLRVAVTDDHEQGLHDAKLGLPFYASLRQYDSYFVSLGLAGDARRVQDDPSPASVSDALAEELVLIGSDDEVTARIAEVLDVADDLCLSAPAGVPPERAHAYERAIETIVRGGSV
jgi:alkanesulfonate monooxygenase SsuD/methylene tetrahydromethanopterin reductase-like flavin-dependent oxidoreductase (luciferase family)